MNTFAAALPQDAAADLRPVAPSAARAPSFPVEDYQLERRYANGASIRPLPCRRFTDSQVAQIAQWLVEAGWEVTSRGPTRIHALNSQGWTVDDLPSPYTASKRRRDAALQTAQERVAALKTQRQAYLLASPAREFIVQTFGDTLNPFNAASMAMFLDGVTARYEGLLGWRNVEALQALGIDCESGAVQDIAAAVKRRYQRSATHASAAA